MSKKLLGKLFVILLVAGLLFAAAPTMQAKAADTAVACTGTGDTAQLQGAIDSAAAGDVITVSGTCVLESVVNVNKAVTLQAASDAKIQVSGTGDRFDISAAATLTGFKIQKTDKTAPQDIIRIRASGINITNNEIWGEWIVGDGEVTRAMVMNAGAFTDILISGNTIHHLRQPLYISGTNTGTISNNFVHDTKGFVVEGGNMTFTGNTWANNVGDIAILIQVPSTYYTDIVALSNANNGAVVEDQRLSTPLLTVAYVDDSAAAGGNGTQAAPYQTIQAGIDRVITGGTVNVAAGTYAELLTINKEITLLGPNAGISAGVTPGTRGAEATVTFPTGITKNWQELVRVASDNVIIDGFTFTYQEYLINIRPNMVYAEGVDHLTIKNNIFIGGETAVDFEPSATQPYSVGLLIENNYVDSGPFVNSVYNRGFYIFSTGGVVRNNIVLNTSIGIQILPWREPTGGTVEGNIISSYSIGLYQNNQYPDSGVWTWKNNTVTTAVNDRLGLKAQVHSPYTSPVTFRGIHLINYGVYGGTVAVQDVFEGNSIDGTIVNTSGVIGSEAIRISNVEPPSLTGTTATFTKNKFTNYTTAVNNSTNVIVNAEKNWWGSAAGPAAGSLTGVDSYIPWCTNAECTEFAGPVTNVTQGTYYTTIQAAIDEAHDGDVIEVAPGTYAELVTVNKAITLNGPNAAVAGDGNRIEEAILTFPDGLTNIGSSLLTVNSDGVTVAGLKFQDKAYIQPLFPIHIYTLGANNLTVKNNLFIGGDIPIYRDPYVNAINPDNTGWLIENNKFVGGPFVNSEIARAMYIYKTGATIQNNVIEGYGVGIQILPATAAIGGEVKNNTIAAGHIGLYHNGHDKGAGAWTYSGNTITVAPNDRAANQGIYDPFAVNATVNFRAIQITNFGQGGTGDLPTVTFSNNVADLQPEATSSLADKIAVRLNLTSAAGTAVTLEKNSFVNYTVAVRNETVTAVDASPNWWGGIVGPKGEITAGVVYSPWCANPECTEFLPATVTIAPVTPVVCGVTTTSTIDINVAGIPASNPLQGYQFRLHFDPAKTSVAIPATDIVNGGFIADGGIFFTKWIDAGGNVSTEPTGIIEVIYSQIYPATSTGSGKLASITLTHVGVPGDIDFTLTDVLLSSRDGIVIPSEASATATTLTLQPAVMNTTKSLGYCDLGSAVAAASAGDTLQLQADITIPTTVTINKELVLDLNGKVASYPAPTAGGYALVVSAGGDLTVNDASNLGAIRAIGTSGRGINVKEGGTLEVNGGSIQGEYTSVYVRATSSMILNGGTIGGVSGVDGAIQYSGIVVLGNGTTDSATLTVNGGEIVSYDFAISGNGSLDGSNNPLYGGTKIIINNGTITSTGALGEAIYHPQAGTLNISGGTITGHQGVEMRSGTLNLTGGTIHAIGNYVAVPDLKGGWSTDTGDAIYVGTSGAGYAGNVVVNISGTPIITSDNGFALREEVLDGVTFTNTQLINVTGGTFTGGTGTDEAGAAVKFDTVDPAILKLTGGLYNTDPADNGALVDPVLYVFVPYGTKYNGTMYEIVSISVHFNDFYYVKNATMLGVTGEVTATNFLFSEASSVVVKLYSGTAGNYVLLQTNVLKTPASYPNSGPLGSPFNIFGTYQTSSWTNTHEAEYGQHVAPTHIEVTVVVPTGTLTAYADNPGVYTYPDIQPSILISDFGYWDQSGVRGLSAGVGATNFNFNQATDIKLELFAGTQLLQTNTAPSTSPLFTSGYTSISGPFDIFGTFDYGNDGYWSNVRQSEYGQTVVPTKVVATVTLPGDVILTAVRENPTGDRTTILPGVSGLVTLQGILTPKADVKLTLTSGAVVRDTFSTVQSSINYGFTGVETLTYTFTTSQARYLNVTTESGKTFLVNRDLTLTPLRLYGGDVDQNNNIQVNDASLVGTDWGSTLNPEANINYDGIVNIQDLALVGGNFGLTSATAYDWWSPLP